MKIYAQHILFPSVAQIHNILQMGSEVWSFLLYPKIDVTTGTLATSAVTAWTATVLKQYIILSIHKGTTNHTVIETLQNCLRFQRTPMNSSPIHKFVI